MKLTSKELELIAKVGKDKYHNWRIDQITRKSDREYDVVICGVAKGHFNTGTEYPFSAWLPLSAIWCLVDWTRGDVPAMTDYPEMTRLGDWSSVRDICIEKIWTIFEKCVLNAVES